MKRCPQCNQINQDEAIICRHCGVKIGIEPTQSVILERIKKITVLGWVAIFFSVMLIILLIPLIRLGQQNAQNDANRAAYATSHPPTATVDHGDRIFAFDACKQQVINRLKAPLTAKFQNQFDSKVEEYEPNHWRVIAYVDSQNTFGAMVRTGFICKVKYVGSNNWEREELVLNQ